MLTKNGKNMLLQAAVDNTSFQADLKTTSGTLTSTSAINNIFSATNFKANTGVFSSQCVYCTVGNGTTEASESDYCMESEISSLTNDSFVATKDLMKKDSVFGNEKLSYRVSYTNNTTENVTISELGMYYAISETSIILWYHKTFEPITLAPNETYTFAVDLM